MGIGNAGSVFATFDTLTQHGTLTEKGISYL